MRKHTMKDGTEALVHDPKNTKPYEFLYAMMSRDKEGNEGIVAVNVPFVTGDVRQLEQFKRRMPELQGMTDKKLFIATFQRVKG